MNRREKKYVEYGYKSDELMGLAISLSLSLSHTHTHTHTHIYKVKVKFILEQAMKAHREVEV